MGLPKIEGRIVVGATCNVDVQENGAGGPFTVAFTAGNYFLADLCVHIGAALTASASLAGTYTCSIDDGTDSATGRVTISATGISNFTLAWSTSTSQALRDALGFTGNLTPAAASHQTTAASRHIWLPTAGRAECQLADGDDGAIIKTASVSVSPSGTTRTWVGSSTRYENLLSFKNVKGYRMLTSLETRTNESLQTFWTYSIGLGLPIRYYKERATDGTYNTYVADEEATSKFDPEKFDPTWDGTQSLWNWRARVFKYTGT